MEFEWDETKRQLVLAKHGIDFVRAARVFRLPHIILKSSFESEERWIAVGISNGEYIAVVFTVRRKAIRIITDRKARKNERRQYHARYS